MPNVIATGGAPPDPNQLLLNQGAAGIGAGFGARIGQNMATNRLARDIDPLRQALLSSMQQSQGHLNTMTPQQQLIYTATQDPRLFAQLAGSAQGAVNLAGSLGAPKAEPYEVQRLVSGDSELGQSLGLRAGQEARVKFNYDGNGSLVGAPSLVANPLSGDEDDPAGIRFNQEGLLRNITDFAEGFAGSSLTPDQERAFLTSVVDYTQPEQFTDPDTGLVRTRRNELPRYVSQALRVRGYQYDSQSGSVIPPVQEPPMPEDLAAATSASQAAGGSTDMAVSTRPPEIPTLFESAQQGDINGPVAWGRRFATRFGLQAQAELSAFSAAKTLTERVVKSLQQSPRYAEGEAQRIGEGINFDPKLIAGRTEFMQRAIAADDTLARIEQENYEVITGKRAMVPGETRQHAMATLNAIANARAWLAPRRVNSDAEAAEFNRLNPPGTPVLYQENGTWQLGYTEGTGAQQ